MPNMKRVGQVWCGLGGHNLLLRYQRERLSLECTHCGYESPGWELGSDHDDESVPAKKSPKGWRLSRFTLAPPHHAR